MKDSFDARPNQAAMENISQLLVERQQKLLSFARRLTRNQQNAEDLLGDTILRAISNADKFEAGSNASGWLNTIMIRIHITNVRRDTPRKTKSFSDYSLEGDSLDYHNPIVATQEPTVEENILRTESSRESVARVQTAINRIPGRFAAIIRLVDLEERSYAEVAKILKIPNGTVSSRLNRGRERLLHELSTG